MWYVVQVFAGQEQKLCEKVRRAAELYAVERGIPSREVLRECFSPRYRTKVRRNGEWADSIEPLLPGYLIAVTNCVDMLSQALKAVPDFTRVLGSNDAFIPLSNDEAAWIDAFTGTGHRVVEMSEGFKEGGVVRVTSGPLIGFEGLITRVNRRKHEAYLQIEIMGRKKEIKVGFNLVRKV